VLVYKVVGVKHKQGRENQLIFTSLFYK